MNNEKVKEIKELLLRKAKEYESQTLLDILYLINELESDNERLKHLNNSMSLGVDLHAESYKQEITELDKENQQLKDRIAKLEKENAKYKQKLTINQWVQEIRKEALKQFAERLKGKLQDFGDGGVKGAYITEKDIDETLKEFIND